MATPHDPDHVGRHDEHQLRQFLAARRAGDEELARRWWDDLVRDNFDRVRDMVFFRSRGHLSADEQDEATQRAVIKITNNMITTFNGNSVGEWVECTRTLVFGVCVDTQRKAASVSKHEQAYPSPGPDEESSHRQDSDAYRLYEDQRSHQESVDLDEQDLYDGQAFLAWALPKLSAQERHVIELDREGLTVGAIQDRLGVSRDVVYASRSRAMKRLAKLRDEYPR